MTKAIIYDTDKQEYVTAVNRRLVSGNIDYLTSKDVKDAQIIDADNLNLRDIENIVGLKRDTLTFQDVSEATLRANKRRKAINEILEKIESYSTRFDSRDDAQELTEQLLYHLQNIYGLDTDYWQDDLKGMLDDAFDY